MSNLLLRKFWITPGAAISAAPGRGRLVGRWAINRVEKKLFDTTPTQLLALSALLTRKLSDYRYQ